MNYLRIFRATRPLRRIAPASDMAFMCTPSQNILKPASMKGPPPPLSKLPFQTQSAAFSTSPAKSDSVPSGKTISGKNSDPFFGEREQSWWTGKNPQVCPGVGKNGQLYSLPALNLGPGLSRQKLQDYFDNTWTLTEVLMSALQGEQAFRASPYHGLRHPLVFYYGHTACLYVNTLRLCGLLSEPVNSYFENIFEMGVDEMSWDDMSKNEMNWPALHEITVYRKQVYDKVTEAIAALDDAVLAKGVDQSSPVWGLGLSFEHERIHLETSSCLITEMKAEFLKAPKHFPPYHSSLKPLQEVNQATKGSAAPKAGVDYPANHMVAIPTSEVSLGKPKNFPTFGWDNEYGISNAGKTIQVPAFKTSKQLISNGEFYDFVSAGGYSDKGKAHWSEEGWKWRSFRDTQHPSFWRVQKDKTTNSNTFFQRLVFNWAPMNWAHPVIVNFHEAAAYANWRAAKGDLSSEKKRLRLCSELEHIAMRDTAETFEDGPMKGLILDPVMEYAKTNQDLTMASSKYGMNLNMSYLSTCPVNAMPANSKGLHDVMGNAWQWCVDYFNPLQGFEIHPFYHNFSTPCFDGKHQMIKGGSFFSTGDEASYYSRFHFRPHFFQHASFRVVEGPEAPQAEPLTSDTGCVGPYCGEVNPFRGSAPKSNTTTK